MVRARARAIRSVPRNSVPRWDSARLRLIRSGDYVSASFSQVFFRGRPKLAPRLGDSDRPFIAAPATPAACPGGCLRLRANLGGVPAPGKQFAAASAECHTGSSLPAGVDNASLDRAPQCPCTACLPCYMARVWCVCWRALDRSLRNSCHRSTCLAAIRRSHSIIKRPFGNWLSPI
jgi:hypothetical protein